MPNQRCRTWWDHAAWTKIADTAEENLPMWVFNGLIYSSMVVVSIFQVYATADGVAHFTGWSSLASWLIAIVMGWMPLLGTVTGIYGAITAWNWPLYGAVTFFTWPIVLVIVWIGIAVVQSRM
jgi:hypothetical protein